MSLKQTYTLAHTARCKLHLAADRPDRDLRFLVGHAMHLDSLLLRIIEIEENVQVETPSHSSGLSFKGVVHGSTSREVHKSPLSRKSPPPRLAGDESSDDDDDGDGDDEMSKIAGYEEEAEMGDGELSLSRFPSGSSRTPRSISSTPTPALDPSDKGVVSTSSSSSDNDDGEEYNLDPAFLRELVKTDGDEGLKKVYHDISSCPCHEDKGAVVERMWEVPRGLEGGKEGVRYAVAEFQQSVAAAA
ncbi:hypothetical protein E2P81_ATG01282 [Venturia nashicola]|uniref:Uncharacterized protein n=1 Tax=Venturia nashicola TaxID=86259 RepID=A0A4Z1PLR6_9PEZI|nr:hypothetical protein E6O75_ATG01314 [Venturia nashicola]TLD38739.1 hypothetical protein E2P81_ATG01282 [Venturia nashicola]